eukprot:CAMPEP_0119109464 /NCGR_PEP_ID=MMETSP1180-20130426/17923_1 /TAXON_ID=3052 ORGANISM="Chlamydomonas cf sp, Strain CCMP681" /NCGR_SAMPLE_ID=MMETSP1180 /ASSEMBLY_ACC=CAM_ASM_000741 /LENGTH=38 /DNA_ID= /DNA_START= /DNA_END= /DNA_ORIENTATION=
MARARPVRAACALLLMPPPSTVTATFKPWAAIGATSSG